MQILPLPPFKATTRNGLAVEVKKTDAVHLIGGHAFPLIGFFERPSNVSKACDPYAPHRWMADGKFDMPNGHEHPLDLVSFVHPWDQAGQLRPFDPLPVPSPQQDLTPPAAPSVSESTNQGTSTMTKIINGITVAALTAVQAAIIRQARAASPDARGYGADERKQIKREVYSVVKAKFGIPETQRVSAVVDTASDQYLVLHTGGKRNGPKRAFRLGADGRWDGTFVTKQELFPPPAPVEEPAKEDVVSASTGEFDPDAEVGQGANGFLGVAATTALPDGISLVSVSDRTVVVEINADDWAHDVVGNNGDRHIFTRND